MQQPLPYIVRPMEPADIPLVIAIDRLSFPQPWSASSYLYELRHRDRSSYYVLLKPTADRSAPLQSGCLRWLRSLIGSPQESQLIGYIGFRLQRRDTDIHISTIAVHPEWRGRRLGELLLLTVMQQALTLKASTVSLEVRPSNQVAQRLYGKYGFQFKGLHPRYYRDGEDAWLMEIQLDRDLYQGQLARLQRQLKAQIRWQQRGVGQKNRDTL